MKSSTRSGFPRRVCALVVFSCALVFTVGAAQAAATTRAVAWPACGVACSVPSDLSGVTAVAAGSDFSLALRDDGTVAAWGCGFNHGECTVPAGLSGVTAVAAGHFHSLALKGDGTVAAWGCGGGFDDGQCTVPGGLSGVTAVSAAVSDSLALKSDGTVVAWGCAGIQDHGQCNVPAGLTGVTAIAAGSAHSLALKTDGTVVAWGCAPGFDYGQCSVPSGLSGVSAIAAGHTQSLALKSDGTVVAWGCGDFDYGQCTVPAGLSGVTAIAAGYGHSLALKSDGTVVGWGCADGFSFGQCTAPSNLARVRAISAGDFDSLAVAEWIDQTISFDPLADRSWGDLQFLVSATASSGLPVAFSAGGNCFIANGALVRFTTAGTCTVTASQPGGLNYNAAPAVSRTFTITKVQQSIIFGPLADQTYGDPDFTVTASESLTLPVQFAASGSCTVNGTTVHLTGAGSCTITASGEGNVDYDAPPDVSRTFAIAKAGQSISFGPVANTTYGAPDFDVSASASSGQPVSFAGRGNCTVSAASVHISGAGSCEVTASQRGDANHAAAANVSRSFTIGQASQTIAFGPLANKPYGDPDFAVAATASSGLAVSFAAGGNCTVSGAIVHLSGAGSCTITASQTGNANYKAALEVSRVFAIAPAPCTVPNVVGKRVASAKMTIAKRHCRAGKVGHAYSRKHKQGLVISQSRRPGRVLSAGSKIDLVVSRGPRR